MMWNIVFFNFMHRKIASMKATKEVPVLFRNEELDIGSSDAPDLNSF